MIIITFVLGLVTLCCALYFKYPWIVYDLVFITSFRQLVKKVRNSIITKTWMVDHFEATAKRLPTKNFLIHNEQVKKVRNSIITKTWMVDHFEATAKRLPTKNFLIHNEQGFTYYYMNKQANKVANLAIELGWKNGDVIALNIANEPALLWTFLGLAKCGITSCMLNTNLRHKSLKHCLHVSDVNAIIVGQDKELQNAIEEVNTDVPVYAQGDKPCDAPENWFSFDELMRKAPDSQPDKRMRASLTARSPLFYVFTSGTTGLPKAAIVSQDKGLKHGYMLPLGGLKQEDIVYTPLPLYHVAALAVTQCVILLGSTLVIREKLSVTYFWEDCRKNNVTCIHYIGEMCRYLLSPPKSENDKDNQVRLAFGNGLRTDIWGEFKERFGISKIVEVYASTDGNAVFMNIFNKQGSCGYFSPLMKRMFNPPRFLKYDLETGRAIRNDNGLCVEVEQGEPGLLVAEITMASAFDGYVGKKEQTDAKILRDVFKIGDTYLNSGDLLRSDKDHFLYFSDRTGDTFRWKGENVSTTEVSNTLCEISWIEDANVYGVLVPGCEGKCGMAAITLKDDHTLTPTDLQDIYSYCNTSLVSYARPRFIRVLLKMETTSTLKQLKMSLVKEGFDPGACKEDALYYLDTVKRTFSVLDSDSHKAIVDGELRL